MYSPHGMLEPVHDLTNDVEMDITWKSYILRTKEGAENTWDIMNLLLNERKSQNLALCEGFDKVLTNGGSISGLYYSFDILKVTILLFKQIIPNYYRQDDVSTVSAGANV